MKTLVNTNMNHVNNDKVNAMLDQFGLNWKVEKRPLFFQATESIDVPTDYFGVIRTDNNDCFGAMTNQYEPFQNSELAELVLNISDVIDKPVTHGKVFKGGRRVAMQIELEPIKVGFDTIKRYATAINSHDGSTSLRWGTTGYTVSCDNQFSALRKDLQSSAKHTGNMRQLIDNSFRTLERLEKADTTLYDTFRKMTEVPVTTDFVNDVIKKISKVDLKTPTREAQKLYSTRAINKSQDLFLSTAKEMSYKGQTLWGLFSGITHYTTHKGGSDRTREESKLIGGLQKIDQTIFDQFSELVS
jgi:phage/plasmid-like protein (TIGR03299 family)